MKISLKWLNRLLQDGGVSSVSVEEAIKVLTMGGLEVEGHTVVRVDPNVVIARVVEKSEHPKSKKLSLLKVSDGSQTWDIVCGAPNAPSPEENRTVCLARLGAHVGDIVIAERAVAGVTSQGMLVSEAELNIGFESDGILLGDFHQHVGQPMGEVYGIADDILELNVTPNRADALGHWGVARDLAALFQVKWDLVETDLSGIEPTGVLRFKLKRECGSLAYGACAFDSETLAKQESPSWLKQSLHSMNVRSISLPVDVSNWVMFETGHPIHVFDADKIHGTVRVRSAKKGEVLETLDGIKRELAEGDLLIVDDASVLALAGVMGGKASSVGASTRRFLVECAHFDPAAVRQTSKRLGMHTDASHRFERGVDPKGIKAVLVKTIQVLQKATGGALQHVEWGITEEQRSLPQCHVRSSKIKSLLGWTHAPDCNKIFKNLGANVIHEDGDGWIVEAPSHRVDLHIEEDWIEEVARVVGYDQVPNTLPRLLKRAGDHPVLRQSQTVRNSLVSLGYLETIQYGFISEEELSWIPDAETDVLRIQNPISKERTVMRTSLLPGLLSYAKRVMNQQQGSLRAFELGKVYSGNKPHGVSEAPQERLALGVVLHGPSLRNMAEAQPSKQDADVCNQEVVAVAKALLLVLNPGKDAALNVKVPEKKHAHFHPQKQVQVSMGKWIAICGEIHPSMKPKLGVDGALTLMHLVFPEDERETTMEHVQVQELPRFPHSTRDTAFVIPKSLPYAELAEACRTHADVALVSFEPFDVYEGKGIADDARSIAVRFTYRHAHKTLEDKEVDGFHSELVNQTCKALGITARQ